ncbi:HD domain-containing protein [uncultured Gammaproteobacteria bacterium]
MPPVLTFARALDFAAQKHTDQRRKGSRAEPYLNHLAEVARMLAEATDGEDLALIVAGLLHDTVEDTATSREELVQLFGTDVADLVMEVTDDKSLTKAERKQAQVTKTPHKTLRARMIKLADKTSNLRALCTSPPRGWSVERRLEYFDWAKAVVAGCRGINAQLEQGFDRVWHQGMEELRGLGAGVA